jgi:hypothetical protein
MRGRIFSLILAMCSVVSMSCATTTQRATVDNASIEQQIRRLDAAEADGLLRKDVPALERIWAAGVTRTSG